MAASSNISGLKSLTYNREFYWQTLPILPQYSRYSFALFFADSWNGFPDESESLQKFLKIQKRMLFFHLSFFSAQVSGLNSGRGLKITIYAANANGRSSNIVLEGFTLKVAELQLGKPRKKLLYAFDILQYVIFILSIRNVIFSQRKMSKL